MGVVAAGCCGEDRRVRRSVEMGGVSLASVYLCGFSGLLCQGQKRGEGGGLFFLKKREEGLRLRRRNRFRFFYL